MKNLILISVLAISFFSCNNSDKEQEATVEKEVLATEKQSAMLELGCYSYSANNNDINFKITSLENDVNANLSYNLDGKDNNHGSFKGELIGDKLIGEYTFMSEGVMSKREIAFLVKDGQLIEGYGELNETGTAFVDKSKIYYNATMILRKTECKK